MERDDAAALVSLTQTYPVTASLVPVPRRRVASFVPLDRRLRVGLTGTRLAPVLGQRISMEGEPAMRAMWRRSGAVAAALAVAVLLAACQSMTGETLGENIDDAGITAAVKSKLAAEKISTVTRIDVDTNRGVVALNGTVKSVTDRARVEELARQVKGVRDVVNNLRIQPA
ncbi:MAG TPA: BON domain-containing protein [Methylomirabilota bacterium]